MSDARARLVARLLALALVALAACALIYLLAVQTEIGQRADTGALRGGERTPLRAQAAANRLLQVVSVGGLLIGIAGLGAVAALRRRRRLILVPGAVIGISLLAVELLKNEVLARPTLLEMPAFAGNTYPSGHVTVAISIGLGAVIVAPPAIRGLVALLAASAAAGFGILVVTAGWHLPSDALGAYAITLGVACGVMAAVYRFWPDALQPELEMPSGPRRGSDLAGRIELAAGLGAVALFLVAILFASLRYGPEIDWQPVDAAYLGAMATIVVAAGLTVGAMLRGLSVDRDRIALAARPGGLPSDASPRRPTR